MARKELSDKELMKIIGIDAKTLSMFKRVRQDAMLEAKGLASRKNKNLSSPLGQGSR